MRSCDTSMLADGHRDRRSRRGLTIQPPAEGTESRGPRATFARGLAEVLMLWCSGYRRSDGLLLQLAALPLRQAAPDPEALVVLQRVLEALAPDVAAEAHLLGFAGGTALLRE